MIDRDEASLAYGRVMNALGEARTSQSYRSVEFKADVENTIGRAKRAGMTHPCQFGLALIEAGIYPLEDYFGVRVTAAEKRGA